MSATIETLAMDGSLVAYGDSSSSSDGPKACHRALVWNLGTNVDSVVSGAATCAVGRSSFGRGVLDVAIAGSRVAWIVGESGTDEAYDTLYSASLSGGHEQRLAEGARFGSLTDTPSGDSSGTWIWRLKGGGDLIVAEFVQTEPSGVVGDSLRRLTATGIAPLVGSSGRILDFDVNGGRVAVLRGGTSTIYSRSGSTMRSVRTPGAYALALDGSRLVVARPHAFDVYDAADGALLHTWRLQKGPEQGSRTPVLDAAAGVAVFEDDSYDKLYGVDLATGKERLLVSPGNVNGLAIGTAGLVYTFGLENHRLGFLTLAAVKAALG